MTAAVWLNNRFRVRYVCGFKSHPGHKFLNSKTMKRKVSFYKDGDKWYAEVPFIPKANNLMVAGADTFLEAISEGHNRLTLTIETKPKKICMPSFMLARTKHDFWGAEYDVYELRDANWTGKFPDLSHLWLCNVTHFVLGGHPKHISIMEIEKK